MTWTKLDDNFHGHPKVRRAWRNPIAFGLHVLALNYCACHDLDGKVPAEFTEDQVPSQSDRAGAIEHLVACGLWKPNGSGWQIHDYHDYHPSRAEIRAKRDKDAERKRRERAS
jgi:hypothetical protein